MAGKACADVVDDFERVRGGQNPDAHEGCGFAVEADVLVVVFGAQRYVGDFSEADDHAVLLLDHHLAKFFGGAQVGVGDQVDRHHGTLGAAERGKIVIACQRVVHVGGRDTARRHLLGLEPDAHGKGAIAKNVGALHAADGAQFGLHDAGEVVGDLVLVEIGGRKSQVHRGELRVGGLQIDDGNLRVRRKIVADLRYLRLNLSQGRGGVIVDLQVNLNRAQALRAGRLHVVDAVGAGDHALDRRGNESADQVGVRADVYGRDLHHGDVAARILPHAQRANRLQAGDQDHQVDDDRQNRTLNE